MARVISSKEAQRNFEEIAQWAEENREDVVVERLGKPAVAIIPYTEYERFQQMREAKRRSETLKEIEKIRQEVAAGNTDLTPEEAYRLAGFSEEAIQNMVESDKLSRDSRGK